MKNKTWCCMKVFISVLLCLLMLPNAVLATENTNDIQVNVQFDWGTEENTETEQPIVISEKNSLNNDVKLRHWVNYYLLHNNYKDVFVDVPLYLQTDYPDVDYGKYGTIASHGCGITCVSMVTSYFRDKEVAPDLLAKVFSSYNTQNGSLWVLFEDSAEVLDLPLQERTYDWEAVYEALKNGQVIVSLQNSDGIFTKGGHFIVLTKIDENDKIFVNDPNGKNYEKEYLKEGFKNGFTIEQVRQGESVYWIYEAKEFDEHNLLLKEFIEQLKLQQ